MNLLLVIDSLAGGGAQRQLVNLAAGLSLRGHAITVLTYFPADRHLQRLLDSGAQYLTVHKRHRFDPGPIVSVALSMRRLRPDAVIAFLRTPSFYVECARTFAPGIPVIVSERDGVTVNGLRKTDVLAALAHVAASRVVANSHAYLDALHARLPFLAGRSHVIYNGIQPDFFTRGKQRLADGVERYRNGTRLCVVAARLTEQKGAIPLVDAIEMLAKRGQNDISVDWIGHVDRDSDLYAEVTERIDSSGIGVRFRWCGARDDIGHAMEAYDALIVASLHEGTANTLCEAMCSALPVIVTDIADNRRILDNGAAGWLCRSDDAASLADAIGHFVASTPKSRFAMTERAYERARALFAMDRFLDGWEDLCRQCAVRRQ